MPRRLDFKKGSIHLSDDRQLKEEERKKGRKGGGQEASTKRHELCRKQPTDNQNKAER